jgi:hypothetical protein
MSVVTLRPNADDNATWVRTPASTNRFDKLNDDLDTTWISGAGTGNTTYQGLQMTSTSLTGTQRVASITFRMRYKFALIHGYVELRFIRVGEINSKIAIVQQNASTTPIGTVSSSAFATDPSGAEWTQGSLDSLSLRLYDKSTVVGRVAVYELYADVNINNQPTVAAPTVTGNTTSSRPTVTQAFTSTDGLQQTAWQVKVFSAAQYGAAGFSADTSVSSYDSGVMLNDGSVITINKDLINAVTYQAYVRAAQDFNGVKWYSAWAVSAPFTMGFEPIPTPVLTVTSDNTVPRIRNKLSVDTKLNLLTSDDASFEASVGSWTVTGNCAAVTSATQALKGVQSLRMTATAAGPQDMTVTTSTHYSVLPNQAYTFLANFRTAVTARSCRIEVQWYDGAAATIGGVVAGGNVTDSSANFNTQATLTATSPTNAVSVAVQVRVLAAVAAEIHYVDAISMSTSASTTWFAGGESQVDYELVEYTDLTPQHSVVVNLLQPQLALGGETLNSTAGFFTRSNKDVLTFDRMQSFTGEASIRWDSGQAAGSAILDIGTGLAVFDPTYTPPCVPGTQYTISYYVMANTGTHSLRLIATSVDQTGAVVGSATTGATNATITTAFQRLTVTHTAQTGAVGIRISLENTAGDLTPFYIDAGQLEEGASASVWHEGQGVAPIWQPVRGALTALTTDPRTGVAVCYDREAPPGVIRLYRASTIAAYSATSSGVSPTSTWVPAKLGLLDGGTSVVLKDPQNPAHDIRIRGDGLSEVISEDQDSQHPIRPPAVQGFGQRPVITSDWISGVGGSITLTVTDDLDWYRLLQLLETKSALLLQFPEGGQRYVRLAGDRTWARTPVAPDGRMTRPSRYLRTVNLTFVEVDRPPVLA